ncbi:MAG: response regulator [Planctomycetota bacterium]
MLRIQRSVGQGFTIGGLARIEITGIRDSNRVKVAIDAPRQVPVLRDELLEREDVGESPYGGVGILSIEDDHQFADLLDSAFRFIGVGSSTRCSSVDDALKELNARDSQPERPSAVLVDYHLLGATGDRVVSWIRDWPEWRRTPIVMLSGSDDPKIADDCLSLGANAFLRKPDTFTELVSVIDKLLSFWMSPAHRV